MISQCKLCPALLPSESHDRLWQALQTEGYEGVLAAATELGLEVDERDARAHFQYHRPRQARPRKRWRSEKALQVSSALTARQRALVDLTFRVPGLSAKTIGAALYWTGDPERLVAAEKAALRDIRRLMADDIVFRCYLENLSGAGARPDEISGLYFLGANGRAYVERLHSIEIERDEWVAEDSDLGDWPDVYARHRGHESLAAFLRQLPGEMGRRYAAIGNGLRVSWEAGDWLDGRLLGRRFKDPLNEASRLRAAGFAMLRVHTAAGQQFPLPFLYYHDDAARRSELLLDDLLAQRALARSGELRGMLPGIPSHIPLPAVVITSSFSRTKNLIGASHSRQGGDMVALVCDEHGVDGGGLTNACWQPLFERRAAGNAVTLPARLLQHYGLERVDPGPLVWSR